MKPIAEWEKQKFLMISLPHKSTDWSEYLDEILNAYLEFAKAITKYQKLLIIHSKNANLSEFYKLSNVDFFEYECDDTWIRDYGAIDVRDENGEIISYDFEFNAWGGKFGFEKDNTLNSVFYQNYLKMKLKKIDFILEGGSIDFNGINGEKKLALTTQNCLLNDNRNQFTKEKIHQKLCELFGLDDILWLKNGFILGDDTDCHVDTLARFIDEKTIAYAICDDKCDPHFNELLKMEKELQNYAKSYNLELLSLKLPKASFYKNRRLPFTHLNFVFINNALIVPIYNDKNDNENILKLERVVKNRNIIGVDSRVFCRQNGSLHCSCMNKFV